MLGPPLFTVYIDDIDEFAEQIDLILKFADDTKGLQELGEGDEWKNLQDALDGLVEWAKIWGMEFNVKKCKILHVGRSNPEHEYRMAGQVLEKVEEEKDIGIIIHKSLKPTRQCQKAERDSYWSTETSYDQLSLQGQKIL